MDLIKGNKIIEDAYTKIILNIKGRKKKPDDWISIAENVALLVTHSIPIKEIAKKAGCSEQTIRQILKLNELTEENKRRVLEGKILMDAAYRLAGIRDKELQNIVGKLIENMNSHDQREIIQYAKKHPEASLTLLREFKRKVLESKPTFREINIVILAFENELYDELKRRAKKKGVTLNKLIVNILEKWIKESDTSG